ncbi:MAG: trypsin-like peptidase domain-containing protein, partial [Clostridia bacterium]|nr:trypsin-like peptidase domain-containing protein [Clostridia bacterium]
MKNLGNRIKQFREKQGFTQKELAERLGVSAQAISKWENGVNQPDISTLRTLCDIFGIGIDELLEDKVLRETQTTDKKAPNSRKQFWIIFCSAALAFVVCFLCVFIPLSLRDKALSSNDIYKKADPAVFFIEIELENGDKQGGSGFFIDDKGTAVTNYHVVQGGKRGKVILADGKEYALKYVLGKDKDSDLVIIQIDIENSVPVTLADSLNVQTGDRVYAIGYPESFLLGVESSTFTEGIVSKASYTLEGVEYIQTNADITHGNSGGVLLNDKAEVVGITTGAIQINGTSYMNLALPSNNILRIDKTEYVLPLNEFSEKLREYTVRFMNGEQEYATRKVLSGERVGSVVEPIAKAGYTFTGWYTDKNATLPYDFESKVTQDLRLYAGWKANRYTLAFAKGAENATGSVADIAAEYDKSVTLPSCSYSLTNYRFTGWAYDGKTYQAGDTVKNLSSLDGETLTFTALWEKIKKYTLVFDKGESAATGSVADITAEYNQTVTLPDCEYELENYRFTAWTYNGYTYQPGEKVQNLSSTDGDILTFTALWEKIKKYTVSFEIGRDEAQGTLPSPVVVEVGKDYTLPTPSVSCKGWNSVGWQLQGSSTVYNFNESVRNLTDEDGGEITLAVAWERKTYDICLDFGSETQNRSYKVSYGDTVTLPSADEAEKEGYYLTGWQWNGTTYPVGAVIENFYTDWHFAEFKAVWQGKTYSVKYVVITNETTSEFVVKEEQ